MQLETGKSTRPMTDKPHQPGGGSVRNRHTYEGYVPKRRRCLALVKALQGFPITSKTHHSPSTHLLVVYQSQLPFSSPSPTYTKARNLEKVWLAHARDAKAGREDDLLETRYRLREESIIRSTTSSTLQRSSLGMLHLLVVGANLNPPRAIIPFHPSSLLGRRSLDLAAGLGIAWTASNLNCFLLFSRVSSA